jgi:hypothetical protein
VSNLTRRVSNKTFWIATPEQNYPLHFRKVMAHETLGLFKTFENLPRNRGPFLSHFHPFGLVHFHFGRMQFRFGSRLAFTEQTPSSLFPSSSVSFGSRARECAKEM